MTAKKRALLTGGSRGIGQETVLQLIEEGFDVVMSVRSEEDGQRVCDQLDKNKKTSLSWVILHLESVKDVQRDLPAIVDLHVTRPFDVVVLNAGTMFPSQETSSAAVEQCFQVNYLGHFMLSYALIKTRPIGHHIHFVAVASILLKYISWMNPPRSKEEMSLEYGARENVSSGWKAYALSKLALSQLCVDLAEYGVLITATIVNPGNCSTTKISSRLPNWQRVILKLFFKNSLVPVSEAASRVVYGVMNPLPKSSGSWYHENKPIPLPAQSYENRFLLFEYSEKVIARMLDTIL